MLLNYLRTAWRVLERHRLYACINVAGLSLGIACCLLIALLVVHERAYDRFHARADRIYRLVGLERYPSGRVGQMTIFPPQVPAALAAEVPGVEAATSFVRSNGRLVHRERATRERLGLVGPDFLDIFTFPLLAGDPHQALRRSDGIVLTEAVVHRLFDAVDADYGNVLGQAIHIGQRRTAFVVTGVATPLPRQSSLEFAALISSDHVDGFGGSNRGNARVSTYVLVRQGMEAEVAAALQTFLPPPLQEYVTTLRQWETLDTGEDAYGLRLQPLLDVYWDADTDSFYERAGNAAAVSILTALAVVVLLIACTNFAALSLAMSMSSGRALEIGIRKVMGAARAQVVRQFGTEALLLAAASLLVGVALARLLLPVFSDLVQVDLAPPGWTQGSPLLALVAVVAVAGVLAGSYIPLVLSRLHPIRALRGEVGPGGRHRFVLALVVCQYAVSVTLLCSTAVVMDQLRYLRSRDLGYDQEHVVVVHTSSAPVARRYKEYLARLREVVAVTLSDRAFTTGSSSTMVSSPDGTQLAVRLIGVDPDYLRTLHIDLLAGRDFDAERDGDRDGAVLVNETLARLLTGPGGASPVGQELTGLDWHGLRSPVVIGVTRDFHIDALRRELRPLILHEHRFANGPEALVRIRPGDPAAAIDALTAAWDAVAPGDPIAWSFLDANLDAQYRDEARWQEILGYAAALAIAISCLGLFGLASLLVARRTREVAVRKVVGASAMSLVSLLSRRFVAMLVVANVIGWPVAYVLTSAWLQGFAYHVDPDPLLFAGCGVVVAGVALATTGVQTLLAAARNPVDSLRCE